MMQAAMTGHWLWPMPVVTLDLEDRDFCVRLQDELPNYRQEPGRRFSLWEQDPKTCPETSRLKTLMFQAVDEWLLFCGYSRGHGEPYCRQSWVATYGEGEFIPPHDHGAKLSVLFYANANPEPGLLPAKVTDVERPLSGALYLIDPAPRMIRPNGDSYIRQFPCQAGRFIVFPPLLAHGSFQMLPGESRRLYAGMFDFKQEIVSQPTENQGLARADYQNDPRYRR